jgi:hypothetical protein
MCEWKEIDSNMELLDNNCDKYFIKVLNDSLFDNELKNNVLTDMEIEDRFNEWDGADIIFCRIINNKFGFEKDSYIIIHFFDYDENNVANYFTIYYTKGDIKNKELAADIFKEKNFCCSNGKLNYKEKTIFIEPKIRIFYKY